MNPLSKVARTHSFHQLYNLALGMGSKFSGVYPSMDEAAKAAPPRRQMGYDNEEAAVIYRTHFELRWGDYAVVYWLGSILRPNVTLVDMGGNLGQTFYAFEKYLAFPEGFKWIVYDLPASVKMGLEYEKQHPRASLGFTGDLKQACGAEIFLASGILQYLDWSFPQFLIDSAGPPEHVLVNKLPAYEGPGFVTLQDLGPSLCPYRIFNRRSVIDEMSNAGYELIDTWAIGDLKCCVFFHPSRTVEQYYGMYFRRRSVQADTDRAPAKPASVEIIA